MIAKVAEMHALRAAFPEELAQAYVEEEYEREAVIDVTESKVSDELRKQVSDCTTETQLKKYVECKYRTWKRICESHHRAKDFYQRR